MNQVDYLFTQDRRFEEKPKPQKLTPPTPKKTVKDQALSFDFHNAYWVYEELHQEHRTNLVAVHDRNVKYFSRKKQKWKLAHHEAFASYEEAVDFIATLGGMFALEDPAKAPRLTGTVPQQKALATLKRFLEAGILEGGRASTREYDLVRSIVRQSEKKEGSLTLKQWALCDVLVDRFEQRMKGGSRSCSERR